MTPLRRRMTEDLILRNRLFRTLRDRHRLIHLVGSSRSSTDPPRIRPHPLDTERARARFAGAHRHRGRSRFPDRPPHPA
jgi:hypothetical protein